MRKLIPWLRASSTVGVIGGCRRLKAPDPEEGLKRAPHDPVHDMGGIQGCALAHSIHEGGSSRRSRAPL